MFTLSWTANTFEKEIVMVAMVIAAYFYWATMATNDYSCFVPILSMESSLLAKFGVNIGHEFGKYNFGWLLIFYVCIVLLSQISQYTIAACYGSVASMVSVSILSVLTYGLSIDTPFVRVLVFLVSFVITILFMRSGFHALSYWTPATYKKTAVILGIVPSLAFTFVAICNLFTIVFREAVVGKFGFVVLAIILDVILYAVGIYLFFRYEDRYWDIMEEKLDRLRASGKI